MNAVDTIAKVTDEGLLYYPPVETHLIRSKHVRQVFKIQVMVPACTRAETTRFPVLYATDGNRTFDMFKGISHLIQSTAPPSSRYILVGIGYPGECPLAGGVLRARDFTFPGYIKHSVKPPPVEGVLVAEPGTKDFYGADDFQLFIEKELMPFINERYRTVPDVRACFGHSAGAGFELYTLFTKPHLFNRYIISSPGVVYHGRSSAGIDYENYDFVLERARDFIASGRRLDGIEAYMSVGTEEEFDPLLSQWQLTSSFHRLAALLKGASIPGLDLTVKVFPGEGHMTVWPLAFMHGVQALFGMTGR